MHTDLLVSSAQPSLAIVAFLLLGDCDLLNSIAHPVDRPEILPLVQEPLLLTPTQELERVAA
jgi:hypothetical protein